LASPTIEFSDESRDAAASNMWGIILEIAPDRPGAPQEIGMPDQPSMPFTPQEAMEFMQRMWNPFGVPVPGYPPPGGAAPAGIPFPNPAAMIPTLDPAEIDRKIAELRVIANWLAMSQNFMQMSIKTMELQKASLEAMRAATAPAKPAKRKPGSKIEGA
jgi:hypothetical protein